MLTEDGLDYCLELKIRSADTNHAIGMTNQKVRKGRNEGNK